MSRKNENVLRMLIYNNKFIKFLPVEIVQEFPNVKYFHAIRCTITEISSNIFTNLKELTVINMQNNEIYSIDPHSFDGLHKLELLHLGSNQLVKLDSTLFKDLINLKFLYLNINKLKVISAQLLINNKKLENVWFDKNQIEVIDEDIFDLLQELKDVDFNENVCISKRYGNGNRSREFDQYRSNFKNDVKSNCT